MLACQQLSHIQAIDTARLLLKVFKTIDNN